ncbi:MAG: hypothetical protein JNM27_01645 [Leptospirales bacterium]|nr:hypothetical protein [Leptospirales bacterium]
MTSSVENPYIKPMQRGLARLLALANRNPVSQTYGCLDRNYWHFKTIIDFPCATYQHPVLGLAQLRSNGFAQAQSSFVSETIRAAILYWCKIQNRDGSFNEYYENDRSFCPGAFTTFGIAHAFMNSQDLFTEAESSAIQKALVKSAMWLAGHAFTVVQNQMIASMVSLFLVSRITSNKDVQAAFEKRRAEILQSQTDEGWFPEYGGADTGYSWKAMDLFCIYLQQNREDQEVVRATQKLADFLVNFTHPDGTMGGDYCSRATQHIFPFSLEFLSNSFSTPAVEHLKSWFVDQKDSMIDMTSVDEKYLAYFYFNSYSLATLAWKKSPATDLWKKTKFPDLVRLNESNLLRARVGDITAWVDCGRNGVCRIYQGTKLLYADSGYVARADGAIVASQLGSSVAEVKSAEHLLQIQTKGAAGKVDDTLPLRRWIVLFKLVCKTVLRFDSLSYWFSVFIKKSRVARKTPSTVQMERSIEISTKGVTIRDSITAQRSLDEVRLTHFWTCVHSPSGRFVPLPYLEPLTFEYSSTLSGKSHESRVTCETTG